MKKSLLLLSTLCLFFSCGFENQNSKIHGSWQAVAWDVNGKPSGRNFNAVNFEFRADDTYEGSFGTQKETGVYRLNKDDKLYTTENGKLEKAVEIDMPASDTLIFLMNRQGEKERLVLVRE